ncbi:uncharacterized protein LOC110809134 [Carica papaya]|uniref:uncharacterized protein LOC110809134 n=1 Tax=Carica papaya TaxID=3649 RepID=UPI000B8D1AB1|nr:uncharacterized protein LOC110809134 [Carica papaya]
MGRNSPRLEIDGSGGGSGNGNATNSHSSDLGFHSIRDRFVFKRSSSHTRDRTRSAVDRPSGRNRSHPVGRSLNRKGLLSLFKFRGAYLFYMVIFFAAFAFAMASMLLQSSITSVFGQGNERGRSVRDDLRFGSTLKFVPGRVARRLMEGNGLDRLRTTVRIGVRAPRLALILGSMKKDPRSLMLITLMKNLQRLGYVLKIYAVENGEALSMWERLGGYVTILGFEQYGHIDWTIFEGIIAHSLEAKEAITSLMQEPFSSLPLIWIIQEDILASRLLLYEEMGWKHLVSHWKSAFSRANIIVFPDFSTPMLYSRLDTGNFFVIPGLPVDVWAAETYAKTHTKHELREVNGFSKDDMVVLVIGSSFFYDRLSLDYSLRMSALRPLLTKYGKRKEDERSFKFVFLCGNSSDGYKYALQDVASRLGLAQDSIRHYGLNGDVNSVLLISDIVIYGSSQDEQGFPSLIIRAMTFGVPVILPDFPIMKKYVVDGAHGIFFRRHDPEALSTAFSLLISNEGLSKFARTVASSGRLLAKNMHASECITGYARVLENVLNFPSDALLPGPTSILQQQAWEWNLFGRGIEEETGDLKNLKDGDFSFRSSAVYRLEQSFTSVVNPVNTYENETEVLPQDIPSKEDWDVLQEIEDFEEYERVEAEEIAERMERDTDAWDDIYRNARRSDKLKFEANERDEGELERTGQPVCIYEIYSGPGGWPFLHHGSLYRGLSLSTRARRIRSDDVDAVGRLPLLNETHFRNVLCEIGGMFSIANKVDSIHRRPWIGFQSWRAAGRKVSLSANAEKALEEIIQETKGDVMYFWARLDMDGGVSASKTGLTFWSMCDVLNGGRCRYIGNEFNIVSNGCQCKGCVFIMFSRMFVDSLDALHSNSSEGNMCLLGSSALERKHCYCRIMELLVNVWAYHSGRKMIYMDPRTGSLQEQHPLEKRKGVMWAKYFNFTLLKTMDEDLAETADDGDFPRDTWLWPLTGEVHWQGIYEREREERYRFKMDKKRKTKEKLLERLKYGYKQKSLG